MERPYQLSLLPKVTTISGAKWVLGDVAGAMYGMDSSRNLMIWDEGNSIWTDTTADIDQNPVHRGTAYGGKLYIPHGANGYTIFTPASSETLNTGRKPLDFIVWDDRLFMIGSDGLLSYTTDGTNWTDVLTLDSSITPRKLTIYFDRSDNNVIMLATNVGLFTYDPTSDSFKRSQMRLPPHPDNGLGFEVWRPGEDAFVSAGLQVYRYTGAATVPMGPDRSEGVPPQFRGRFVDFIAEHNSLIGLLEGVSTSSSASPEIVMDPGIGMDEEFEISFSTALSSLFAWSGLGWHPKWFSPDDTGSSTWQAVSSASDAYRLWWGYGDTTYTIPLSRSFANPRQRWISGEIEFEETGYVDTGWIDHNMREFDKIASHVEINMEHATEDEVANVYYRTDYTEAWTLLGQANTIGRTDFPFIVEVQDDGTNFSRGLTYRRIRFKVELARGSDDTQSPFVDSFALKYIKVPQDSAYFTITIPLRFEEEWEGRTKDEIRESVEDMLTDDIFHRLEYGSDLDRPSRRVRFSRFNSPVQSGLNPIANITLTAIEVPLVNYDGNHGASL
jgi:hypothetical protein